jgi:uncharacterized protein (DUF4213/DUF364 family)
MDPCVDSADPVKIQSLIGAPLIEVAKTLLPSVNSQERAIGVAALSAASRPFTTAASLRKRGITEGISYRKLLRPTDIVTIVGLGVDYEFLAYLKSLSLISELNVTDMREKSTLLPLIIEKESNYYYSLGNLYPAEDNYLCISKADVVSITASSIVNGTFSDLLSYAKVAREIAVYGSTGDFIPDVLFSSGVTSVEPLLLSSDHYTKPFCNNDAGMELIELMTPGTFCFPTRTFRRMKGSQ